LPHCCLLRQLLPHLQNSLPGRPHETLPVHLHHNLHRPQVRPSPDHKNPVQNHPAYYIFYLCCSLNALLECSSDYNRLSGIFPQNISIITQLMHSMPYIITCYFICIVSCTVHFIRKMYYVIPSVPVSEEPQNINRSAAASLRQFL